MKQPRLSTQAEQEIGLPASIHASFQGTAAAFQNSLSNEPLLILAAIDHRLHRAGRAVRELHPSRSRFSRRCRLRAWEPCWRC